MMPGMNSYNRHRSPAAVIEHVVWLYHCSSLSLRNIEPILAARLAMNVLFR
jgi:putative transposase